MVLNFSLGVLLLVIILFAWSLRILRESADGFTVLYTGRF